VIAGGLAILYTICAQFGIEELTPAKGALRQGVIVDLAERLAAGNEASGHDLRDATVSELQRRFHVDVRQATRVADTAERFFESAWPGADAEMHKELRWASALHELGLMVSHHDHHRHSAYIVSHVDAPGFSQSQQRRLGELVLGQRGGLRKIEAGLSRELTAWQVLCLRLAVIDAERPVCPGVLGAQVPDRIQNARFVRALGFSLGVFGGRKAKQSYRIKPHGQLVSVSLTHYCASTP
jgi:exopolyphosphatase/guanosine-5'-triphosphate,3'-diphosphate pyrophosphatase